MKCFYHGDLDGRAAGFCVHAWVGIHDDFNTMGVNFIEIDYKDRFPIETIQPGEQVWIVDFSIKPAQMLDLLEITKDVTWIDHHKTSLADYADFPHKINGVRRNGEAGCVLTWKYVHWYSNRGGLVPESEWDANEKERSAYLPVPRMITLVGDRDIWAWKYGEETKNFFAGSQMHDTSPHSEFWWKCMEHEIEPLPPPNTGNATARERGERFWKRLLQDGETINKYKAATDEEVNKSLGFDTIFEGFKCWAINRGRISSDRLGGRNKEYDILLPYFHDGKQFIVSLYSEKVDVSVLAKKHGGGGHKGAAGFQCNALPFIARL